MKKVGIGVLAGLALFAVETSKAAPQETQVFIPYFSSTRGMFTAVSYVTTGGTNLHLVYYYKPDLTQELDAACTHYDGIITTSNADMDTFLIVGADNVRPIFSDGGPGDTGTIVAPPVTGEGFMAISGVNGELVTAESHVVVTAVRGVFSFRGMKLDGDGTLRNIDTLEPAQYTTVMMFPEGIAETYIYAIADGNDVFAPTNYTANSAIAIVSVTDAMGVFGRSENGRSGGQGIPFTCAAIVHARDILGLSHYTFIKDTGGWFTLGVPADATNGSMVYKVEISTNYGTTMTPLSLDPYAR